MVAGQGFKDFAVGEVLTSSDVDGFLMQQSVMRFANDAARGSALGTAVGTAVPLAEGMVAYLDDVNDVQVYDGAAWSSVAGVKQVVQTVKTDTFTTSSTSFVDVTGMSVTITPSSTDNKVLVICDTKYAAIATGVTAAGRLMRADTELALGHRHRSPGTSDIVPGSTTLFLDAPNSTSALTYRWQISSSGADPVGFNVGRATSGTTHSSITVIEVAG
jgi:hypothetical protein